MTRQETMAARRTILAWAIRLADERATLDILTDGDGAPVAHLSFSIDDEARADDEIKVGAMTTCLRYYNEVTDDQACPCGCEVTS